MNSFQTEVVKTTSTVKEKLPVDRDELCTCGHMNRKHFGICGEYPCTCIKFEPTGQYYQWGKQNG